MNLNRSRAARAQGFLTSGASELPFASFEITINGTGRDDDETNVGTLFSPRRGSGFFSFVPLFLSGETVFRVKDEM